MSVEKLVLMSNKYGADKNYVLAGGGNTSYKNDELIYVKGSGTSLATITEDGFVIMKRPLLDKMWEKTYPDNDKDKEAEVLKDMMDSRIEGSGSKRPSVETLLHNLFNQKYVLHVHPALVNGITCAKNPDVTVRKLFGERAVYVPAVKPGYTLAVFCKEAMDKYRNEAKKEPDLLILQNHGIFFAGDNTETIDTLVDEVMGVIKSNTKRFEDFSECEFDREKAVSIAPLLRMIYRQKTNSENAVAKFLINKEIKNICAGKDSFTPLIKSFTPDHIVYYKAEPLFVSFEEDNVKQVELIKKTLDVFIEKNKYIPKIIAVENLGCFAFGNTKKESDTAAELFLDAIKIAVYTESFGGYSPLSQELTDFIVNWEVESYRQKVALSSANIKRLDEKIAVVTGSAQGFGKGIAESMVKEGANVVIADMNYDGAVALSNELNQKNGVNKTIAVNANVTDEESIKNMIYNTVLEFGGLDVFVNNAGIVKAGGLDEMNKKDFELVTAVNYTAYFLCVKYASKIMKLQNSVDSSYMTDIVEINSKSGLSGSNKNFAYAGSKFGGIGLTQSFAMELAPYNIKVNAVCPGNFLNGPLWSDPEKGLFVQYLKSGKVPNAKNVEDVKKFYESKVPLNRGCEIEDVMKAVLYVIEQKYETGQAVPVTGGQEMIK